MEYQTSRRNWAGVIAGIACLAIVVGCGGPKPVESPVKTMDEDQQSIVDLVHGLADYAAQDIGSLRSKFTKEAAPKSSDQAKMKKAYFDIDGDITVTGDTATVPVKISGGSTVTWSAAKKDGTWYLSNAPLK